MAESFIFRELKSRQEASRFLAEMAGAVLKQAIEKNGSGRLLLSGGSTPADSYRQLSSKAIEWTKVKVGLVDERNVPPLDPASNQTFIEETLCSGAAKAATLVPMWSALSSPDEIAKAASHSYASLLPADFAVFGMGSDGHTASWFPGADGLERALSMDAPPVIALYAPEAGGSSERLTLTLPVVAKTTQSVLLMFGDEKRRVFADAVDDAKLELPVSTLLTAFGARLTVIWAP